MQPGQRRHRRALTDAGTDTRSRRSSRTARKACHQDLPYRPDLKLLGSYTLPFDVQFSGTYQFSRGVQTGGAAPSILATWGTTPASATTLGRAYSAGLDDQERQPDGRRRELRQPQPEPARPARLEAVQARQVRFRVDFDAYNVFNSDWPFTVTSTFSTAATSNWLRPTNVLQARFFKIGAQFDF